MSNYRPRTFHFLHNVKRPGVGATNEVTTKFCHRGCTLIAIEDLSLTPLKTCGKLLHEFRILALFLELLWWC